MGICSACTGLLLCIRPIFMEVFLLKNNTKKLLCILLALAAVVCIIVACFTLSRRKQTDSASSGSASSTAASVSQFGSVADFDYETFDYSDGLDENGYWSGIKALDYVTLPEDFGSIALKESDLTPTEDELQQQMDSLLNQYTTSQPVTGRAAQSGDVANIDYTGTVDGVAFTGGTATGYDLTLGSGSFIPGFEEQVVGHKAGEEFDVNVKFPEEYQAEELAGKDATFKIKLHEVQYKELPELDDDFAKDVSEYDTLDELKDSIRKGIETNHEKQADQKVENDLIDQVVGGMKAEIPDAMIESRIEELVQDFQYRISQQGLKLEQYLQYMGMTMEQFKEQFREQADKQVKMRLAMEAIVAKESIEATEEEFEAEIKRIADAYQMEADKVKSLVDAAAVKKDLAVNKAIDFVKSKANIVAGAAEEKKPAKKTTRKTTKKAAAKQDEEPKEEETKGE
mgnify:CR=1 FL=1